ncbi:HD domain-containing protein [Chitinophaga pinensis]|uniref:Bifunctional (P)ppGpp synthetase/guanosine-3',5'-bis(Diphosphate) 3'-pyrophosphohydrolase n=1 Tax=Chitinophaga pinensis TaxID=79329 RepID=A0A5C6LSC5_9BACT|nr:HD domain-containing protein [Chitinophaga pinensis]TWV97344.1 bifunctional (p)ppGpp synthetase/guanosine-3',5'-bis(diphosphate) 3'-pyrophosphohydrolase [Chitinophaga pinensis]
MDQLTQVKDFAGQAHGIQRRKFADEPYINHPVRVMEICRTYTSDLPVLSAALLHDVLEDTAVTKDELSEWLHKTMSAPDADRTLKLTVELTDIYSKKNYPHWNRRKRKQMEATRLSQISAAGQTIKYADIIDNANDIASADSDFIPTFLHECRQLLKVMEKGNPETRQRAVDIVNKYLTAAGK